MPSGYHGQKRPKAIRVEEGIGQEFIFELRAFSSLFYVDHAIVIFKEPTLATMAFEQALTEDHQPTFHVNEGLGSASDKLYATNIAWGCDQPVPTHNAQFTINTRYCMTVATYKNVYVEISGHTFADDYLTMEKYFDLVKRLDQRAGEVLKISKPE